MNRHTRIFSLILILIITLTHVGGVYAAIWEFGTSGTGENPFTPRGFLVDTDKGQHWLSSGYNNSGSNIYYSGSKNGVDYLDAKKSDGTNYTFYAMTHRNNAPGKEYIAVYKNGERIDLGKYTGTPGRGDKVDPSGNGTCYVIPIENFELEGGCVYEFCFLQGMRANNGITMVLAPGENRDRYLGYIQFKDGNITSDEQAVYDANKNKEYKFVESYTKDSKTGEYAVNLIPMRFSVQTYADMSKWETAANKAQQFIDSVKDSDYKRGKYKRSNVKALKDLLQSLKDKAENTVKKQLQPAANKSIKEMVDQLNTALEKAKTEKPTPADISKLTAKLKEAEKLYNKAKTNVGIEVGQYGRLEVEDLKDEIDNAKELDRYSPQVDINSQVSKLQQAIDSVNNSLVQKAQMIFYDKITGIYVIVPADALSESATMVVSKVGKGEHDYKDMKDKLPKDKQEAELFDIRFYVKEKRVYPKERSQVQMPISDDMNAKSSTIYSFKNKKLKKIRSVRSNGVQTFKSDLKSMYAMAGKAATEEDKAAARREQTQNNGGGDNNSTSTMGTNKNDNNQGDRSDNVLDTAKKKKEAFKDPITKILKRNDVLAPFSGEVKQKTDPVYLIIFSIILALVAAVLGINAMRKKRESI